MTAFVIAISVLVLLALAFVVPVMLRRHELEADTRDQLNIRIAKDRLAELKRDLEEGNIQQDDYDQNRVELEKTLALDLSVKDDADVEQPARADDQSSRAMALFLLIAVPVVALLIYAEIGFFTAIDSTQQTAATEPHAESSQMQEPQMTTEEAISKLRQRLEAEPDNAEGWFMLARTYAAINEYGKAVSAYEKVIGLVGEDDAGLLLRYADALAMAEGGRLSGAAYPYISKALSIDPQQAQGLWMMGMAQNEKGDYRAALENWYQVLPQLEDERALTELNRMIADVEKNVSPDVATALREKYKAQSMADTADAGAQIQVTVSLDEALRDKVAPPHTVFIFARAVSGPPMPLAAVKQPVSALPLTVTLTDAMAMMPAMKLSMFEQVTVGAKISSTGAATPAAGDLFGELSPVNVAGADKVKLVIDQIR